MSDDVLSVLEQEMRGLIHMMGYQAFPWSGWNHCREEKEKAARELLAKLNRVNRTVVWQSDSNERWAAVFGSAYILGLALHGIQFQERRNRGEEPNPESEFNKFLEIYPSEAKAEVERRKRQWRNSRMSEGKQRLEAKKLIAKARSLAAEVDAAWDVPLVQGHLAESGARELISHLNAFAVAMEGSLRKQPFQKDNSVRLKRTHFRELANHFKALCGKPKYQLIAEFASLVDPRPAAECDVTAKSVREEIKKLGDKKGS